jgi:hypothetical protein
VFFNAENAEHAENGKDRETANSMLCETMAEIPLPLLLNPPSAISAFSLAGVRPPWPGCGSGRGPLPWPAALR